MGAAGEISCYLCGKEYEIHRIERGLELFSLIQRVQKVVESSDPNSISEETRDDYLKLRCAYFAERVPRGEVGWKEWDGAVHAAFRAILNSVFMEKVEKVGQTLERFLRDSGSIPKDSIEEALRFFLELAKGMK